MCATSGRKVPDVSPCNSDAPSRRPRCASIRNIRIFREPLRIGSPLSGGIGSSLTPAAAGAPGDSHEDVLRRSMQLALRETLEAGLLSTALGRRSQHLAPESAASTEVTVLGDVSVVADSVLDGSALVGQRAFEETQSIMGASQVHLGNASFDGYGSGETQDHEGSFTGGLAGVLHLLGDTLTVDGGLDGGLVAMLRQIGDNDLDVTARQARQLGHVLAGDRLSDSDIQALPKVTFDKTEEQTCAVCLVGYQQGELLTQLPCNHFFHVGCIAEWMQRATRCPLCRADCSV